MPRILTCLALLLGALPVSIAAQGAAADSPAPFEVEWSTATLDDLRQRLRQSRLPPQIPGQGWRRGTDVDYLREFVRYWAEDYDFAAAKKRLNAWPQFRVDIDGLTLHYQHVRAAGNRARMPLLTLH
jgi:epoxide hydrolase